MYPPSAADPIVSWFPNLSVNLENAAGGGTLYPAGEGSYIVLKTYLLLGSPAWASIAFASNCEFQKFITVFFL